MGVSRGRLNGVRVVLVVCMLIELSFGLWALLFPKSAFESFAPAGEPYTTMVRSLLWATGTFSLTWAVAMAIVLRNVVGSRSLVQAIVAFLAIFGVLGIGVDAFVLRESGSVIIDVLINVFFIVLAVSLLVLYPWKQAQA